MSLVALVLLPLLVSPTLSLPLGFGQGYPFDYGYNYLTGNDYAADFFVNPGFPRAVDYARQNFVRESPRGPTEYGTRDEITVRQNGLPSPYSRFYPYNPNGYLPGLGRFPFDFDPARAFFGPYLPRPSPLVKLPGDGMYLR